MTVLSNSECRTRWESITGAEVNAGHICIGSEQEVMDKSACNASTSVHNTHCDYYSLEIT